MKVFLAVKSLLPSYGGPAFSVSRLARALADAGVDVGLWAADGSAPAMPLVEPQTSLRRFDGGAATALARFGRPDVVHDNGIWLLHNHQLAKIALRGGVRRVVSTRGMLDPWAINHKRWKKRLAWSLYQRRDLSTAAFLHATAAPEAEALKGMRLGVPIGLISNGIDVADFAERRRSTTATKTALFLGRLHPVKGLPLLVEAWARLLPQHWRLCIAGPNEMNHRSALERKVAASSLSNVVHFTGPLHGAAKEQAFAAADLFVLPSLSESFGMAVGEALGHGVPVLTTTAVPWPMLGERGCGWRVSATVDGLTEGLRVATTCAPHELAIMGERGRDLVAQEFSWSRIARQFMTTYENLTARSAR